MNTQANQKLLRMSLELVVYLLGVSAIVTIISVLTLNFQPYSVIGWMFFVVSLGLLTGWFAAELGRLSKAACISILFWPWVTVEFLSAYIAFLGGFSFLLLAAVKNAMKNRALSMSKPGISLTGRSGITKGFLISLFALMVALLFATYPADVLLSVPFLALVSTGITGWFFPEVNGLVNVERHNAGCAKGTTNNGFLVYAFIGFGTIIAASLLSPTSVVGRIGLFVSFVTMLLLFLFRATIMSPELAAKPNLKGTFG